MSESELERNIEFKCNTPILLIYAIDINKWSCVCRTGSRKRKLSAQDEALEIDDRSSFVDRSHPIYQQQQFIQPQPPTAYPVVYQHTPQYHWSPIQESSGSSYDNRRGSLNSIMTASSDSSLKSRRLSHIDRRPSVPFSPPHQPYDSSRVVIGSNDQNDYNHKKHYQAPHHYPMNIHHRSNMIPSPPPQSSLFKPELRRSSLDDALSNNSNRRQPADPNCYHSAYRRGSRRMSLQQHNPQLIHPPARVSGDLSSGEVIHLPPLRSIVSSSTLQPDSPKHHYQQQDNIGEVDAAVAMMQLASRRQAEGKVNY